MTNSPCSKKKSAYTRENVNGSWPEGPGEGMSPGDVPSERLIVAAGGIRQVGEKRRGRGRHSREWQAFNPQVITDAARACPPARECFNNALAGGERSPGPL
jgi:hypothetical protein